MIDIEVSLLSALIGGLLAGIGGLAGIVITDKRQRNRDRILLLRDKIELLVTSVFQLAEQVSRHRVEVLYDNIHEHDKDYLDVIQMTTYLYFPELETAIQSFTELNAKCEDQTFIDGRKMKSSLDEWSRNQERDIEFKQMYKQLIQLRNGIADQARDLMKKKKLC